MIYFDKPHNRIEWNEAEGWVEISMLGFVSESEFDMAQTVLQKLIAERKPWAMIVDARKASPLNNSMQQKAMLKAKDYTSYGLRYVTIITPERATTRISMESPRETTQATGLTSYFFSDKESAMGWLRARKNQTP